MKIAIISTGDELLRGSIADTNGAWLAARILELGHAVDRITVLGDDPIALADAIREHLENFDLTFVGGGLGPTQDDITAQAAARALNVNLRRYPEAVDQVRARFVRIGREMHEINLKQADLPEGAQILANTSGTAPGFSVALGARKAVFFPGVPSEMRDMFRVHVEAILPEADSHPHEAIFRCFGMGESNMQAALAGVASDFPGIRLAFRASFPEIGLTLKAPDPTSLEGATAAIQSILGRTIFSRGKDHLPQALGRALSSRGLTISAAESCTGGLIGHTITEIPGSSGYFRGSVVSYDNEIKISALGVDRDLILRHGAVSEQVVRAMAVGARTTMGTDMALATSGVAGPGGGTDEKPVGLVHIAVDHAGGTEYKRCMFEGYGRSRVKTVSVWTAMRMALDVLSEQR